MFFLILTNLLSQSKMFIDDKKDGNNFKKFSVCHFYIISLGKKILIKGSNAIQLSLYLDL